MAPTVAFFGASTGVGLSALKHSLAAGRQCVALCRNPSKLTAILTPDTTPNLKVVQGNAHDMAAVSQCLKTKEGKFVDEIVFTIGAQFVVSKMGFDDSDVCKKGMSTLLETIAELRREGVPGTPYIVVCSTTGMSRFARDVPLAMILLYYMLKVPHADKRVMEDTLAASDEHYTIVRASMLTNGQTDSTIRVGIEDPKAGLESQAIGYTISREDAGKWIAQNMVLERHVMYLMRIATITY